VTPRLPYLRRWDDAGNAVEEEVSPNVSTRPSEPRELPAADSVYFTLIEPPDPVGGQYVDHSAIEAAVLLEQAAAWLRLNRDRTPLSVALIHGASGDRIAVLLVAE
jgi:hypothetical protein